MNITTEGLAHLQNDLRVAREAALSYQRAAEYQRVLNEQLTLELEAARTFSPSAVRELLEECDQMQRALLATEGRRNNPLDAAAKRVRESEVKK
jgi:uncharacterized membrane protein YccC